MTFLWEIVFVLYQLNLINSKLLRKKKNLLLKKMKNMTDKNINFKPIIRKNILLIGGLLKEEIDDPKLEFGFIFIFPNERGKPMTVVRQKKRNFIEISFGLYHE